MENDKPSLTPTEPTDLHIGPEYAFAEKDVREVISGEVVVGTSLWRDAWRRLLKNKLAVLGMIIVIAIVGVVLTELVMWLERRMSRWRQLERERF